ncbi:NADH:flavin oxidoreductase [Bacillus cereus]|uniref:NADH:flavin oxidoreductase n=2 Tax=Bacillaceae TaxID=186817 RepID=A0AAW4R1U5_BACCE|nr:NADH:flavin oxidoreductase [Bacillus cereus]MBY0039524.1 NADH:flavin oxidoreductase [Bacillus cereus]MCC2507890.1 NADH:flavin oxidoreductase [Bacillus cereus]MDZ4532404.1 NADH:flavin oxidoreductase [Bacillus cereus]MEB8943027.1 NADH:flavin oxidoreductase [Bacillus cereus]PEQ56948.1 12-oxophytodienoate reductase [Bacillus cereus]
MNNNKTLLSKSVTPLFESFNLGNLTLSNRVVMAPMTRKCSPNGVPGPDVAAYYKRRAENGVGLIITEGTVINHPVAASDPNVPRFYGEDALEGWKEVVREVHAAGGRIIPQLWHVGMDRKVGDSPNPEAKPIGPSGLEKPGVKVTDPMTEKDIKAVIKAFAQGAADAQRLGFDGIELHGAHGYLIDQFLWEGTNQREDGYGGDMVARTRFAAEIVEACRQAVGPDFPIIFRLSQWKTQDFTAKLASTPELLDEFLRPLVDAGVDIFHCSTRRFWLPEFEGSELNLAGWVKKLTGKPTITVGSVGLDNEFLSAFLEGKGANNTNIDKLIDMLEQEEVDLVAIGRALLADPAWAVKVRDGRFDELRPFQVESLGTLF